MIRSRKSEKLFGLSSYCDVSFFIVSVSVTRILIHNASDGTDGAGHLIESEARRMIRARDNANYLCTREPRAVSDAVASTRKRSKRESFDVLILYALI